MFFKNRMIPLLFRETCREALSEYCSQNVRPSEVILSKLLVPYTFYPYLLHTVDNLAWIFKIPYKKVVYNNTLIRLNDHRRQNRVYFLSAPQRDFQNWNRRSFSFRNFEKHIFIFGTSLVLLVLLHGLCPRNEILDFCYFTLKKHVRSRCICGSVSKTMDSFVYQVLKLDCSVGQGSNPLSGTHLFVTIFIQIRRQWWPQKCISCYNEAESRADNAGLPWCSEPIEIELFPESKMSGDSFFLTLVFFHIVWDDETHSTNRTLFFIF